MNKKLAIVLVGAAFLAGFMPFVAVKMNGFQPASAQANADILVNLDQRDLKRLDELVGRFNRSQGDNLMVISPTIDSGPWIHDVHTDGTEIVWTVDNTRDAYSSPKEKQTYTCASVEKIETSERYVLQLSKCGGGQRDKLPILDIDKNRER
ncbi:hypothetical protein [Paenibacillus chitinolyticus]|uniref:hypothetical protein n=1 Tax=Paenibacillus chitinolyticus TaxID=79263 RepID=UPI003D08CB04